MNNKTKLPKNQQLSHQKKEEIFFPYKNVAMSPAEWSNTLFFGEVKSAVLSKAERERLAEEYKKTNKEIFREFVENCVETPESPENFLDCCPPWQKNAEESHIRGSNKPKNFEEQYPFLNFELEIGKVTNKSLILFAQQFYNDTPIICKRTASGYKYFPGRRKGDSRYNLEKEFEIKDRCDLLSEIYDYGFFATLTLNKENRDKNLKKERKHQKRITDKIFRKICKKYDCAYLLVFEVHNDGHSHAHFYIWHNHEDWDSTAHEKTTKCKNGEIVKYVDSGIFYDIIHNLYDAGFIEITKAPPAEAANYCRKYITKNFDESIAKIAKKDPNEKLKGEQRKAILGLALTKATKSRSYSGTEKKTIKRKLEEKFSLAEINELKKKYPDNAILADYPTLESLRQKLLDEMKAEREARRELARSADELLEKASTNFSCKYYSGLRIGTFKTIKEALKIDEISLKDCKTDKSKHWILGTKPIGCAGCAKIELYRYINGEFSPWFDLPVDRLSDEEQVLIAQTFAENGYPKIGINPFTVDLRILAFLFPDSPVDKYLKRKYFETFNKIEKQKLNQKISVNSIFTKPEKENLTQYRYKFAKASDEYKKTHFDF